MKHRFKFVLLVLCLLVQSALAQSANFKDNLWFTTWNRLDDGAPQLPTPSAPWHAAMWTTGVINGVDSTAADVANLAKLCRYGGPLSGRVKKSTIEYLRYYNRLDCFPRDRVPASTLLIVDSEGSLTADGYPTMLATNVRGVTKKFCQYPSAIQSGDVARDFSFGWTSRMGEVDFFSTSQMWKRAAARTALDGDYVLLEMYLGNVEAQDSQYRSWALLLASIRREQPDKKILALVQGGRAWPIEGAMTDDERHRLVRFVILGFDGVWCWGIRDQAAPVMDDLAVLADDSLHQFGDAEKNWVKE